MQEVSISLPFKIDPYGKVGSTQTQEKIWSDKVLSVIGTSLRERVMRPAFGTVIPFSLFEDTDNAATEIRIEVTKAFNEQLSLLRLQSVDSTLDEYTNILDVNITYDLPNNQTVTTNLGLVKIDGTNPLYQELL
jgi:phage baseplate assembly protein W